MFTVGGLATVLVGKFAGKQGKVVTVRTDKNGVERVQLDILGNVFSYMPSNLKLTEDKTVNL